MDSVQRRTDKLIVREVEGETVVYDTASEMVTVLDAETAAVWQAADGEAPIEAIAQSLELPQENVEVALVRLGDAGLLKAAMSRRTLLRGAGAAVAAGGLVTLMAPPAYAACSAGQTTSVTASTNACNTGAAAGTRDFSVTVTGYNAGDVTVTIYTRQGGTVGTALGSGIITVPSDCTSTTGTVRVTFPSNTQVQVTAVQAGRPTANTTIGNTTGCGARPAGTTTAASTSTTAGSTTTSDVARTEPSASGTPSPIASATTTGSTATTAPTPTTSPTPSASPAP